jgi:hypothetical protein
MTYEAILGGDQPCSNQRSKARFPNEANVFSDFSGFATPASLNAIAA